MNLVFCLSSFFCIILYRDYIFLYYTVQRLYSFVFFSKTWDIKEKLLSDSSCSKFDMSNKNLVHWNVGQKLPFLMNFIWLLQGQTYKVINCQYKITILLAMRYKLVFTGGKVVLDLYIEKVLSVTTDTLCVFMGSFSNSLNNNGFSGFSKHSILSTWCKRCKRNYLIVWSVNKLGRTALDT